MKKKFTVPHTYVLIFSFILIATAMTWVIPTGAFDRVKDIATGKSVIVQGTYHTIKNSPVNFFKIPLLIMKGFSSTSSIIFLILVVGGAFNIIIKTGMFQGITGKATKLFSNKEVFIIPAFTTIFALACMTMGVNMFIGFAPIAIILARSLGYDAIVGVSMVMLGGAIGFSTGTFNPFTTGVAQALAGLPMFSGVGYRFFSLIVFLIITNWYLISYAKKIKSNPELSVVRDLELSENRDLKDTINYDLTKRHLLVLIVVIVFFGLLIYGGNTWHWKLNESGAIFLSMGIISGLVYGFKPNIIANEFIEGAKKLMFGALIIGLANTISIILTDGKILDTVVYFLGNFLTILPRSIQGIGMFIMQILINGVLTSGSGQAAVTMPIMLPVADMINMTRQSTILAFNFGDGLCNYVIPTSSALMGFLAIANISYSSWMKFMSKLFGIWVITGSVLIFISTLINYGPF